MNDEPKITPPPGCPDDYAVPEPKYKDERPYRRGDHARNAARRKRRGFRL